MKTSELVQFLKSEQFTDDQAYNLIVADLLQFVPQEEVEKGQQLIRYFAYKIQSVCLRAIHELRDDDGETKEESHAGTAQ